MRIAHADRGVDPAKRWVAIAEGSPESGWAAWPAKPMPGVGTLSEQVGRPDDARVLVGSDFPIGLPRADAQRAGIDRFLDVFPLLGHGDWSRFFDVADDPADISIGRPFFPRSAMVKG